MRSRSTRSAARSRRPPTPEAGVQFTCRLAALTARACRRIGRLSDARASAARGTRRPGEPERDRPDDLLGGGGAPRLAHGAGSAAQLSPLVAACPAPRLSQPTTGMRAPDPPDPMAYRRVHQPGVRSARSGASSSTNPSAPAHARSAPAASRCVIAGAALMAARHVERREPDEEHAAGHHHLAVGVRLGRCGRRESRRRHAHLVGVGPEGIVCGWSADPAGRLQPRSRKPPKRDRAEERSSRP